MEKSPFFGGERGEGEIMARYFIDLERMEREERSFKVLAETRLCPSFRERLSGERDPGKLLSAFKECCSRSPSFFPPNLPLKELLFRILLPEGNEPLEPDEIGGRAEASPSRPRDTRDGSTRVLKRLLERDDYYCFGKVED